MNFGIVIKSLGNILKIESALLLVPLTVSVLWHEPSTSAFIWSVLLTAGAGIILSLVPGNPRQIHIREALCIVTAAWIVVSTFAALPYVLSGSIPNFADAFFEAVSGFTTTGATVMDQVEKMPRSILFWRALTQWVGGMGILVLMLAVFPAIGVGGCQIFKAEVPGPIADKLTPRLVDTVKILYFVYGGITILLTVLLLFGGMSLYEALVFTFATVSTGGFSIYASSLGTFADNNYVLLVLSLFMILSGVNFALYYELRQGKWRNVVQNSELRLYLLIISLSVLGISLNLYRNVLSSAFESFKHALVQVSSIITTTGFTSMDFDQWPTFSKLILFTLLFVGGCAGSTTGSVKVIRILIAGKLIKREIARMLHPRATVPVTINGHSISHATISSVCAFLVAYLAFFITGTLLLSLEGIGIVSAASAVATTLGNVGPGFELVGPAYTFSSFSSAGITLLSFMMLLGRLEIFTVAAIFTPSFWRQ